MEHHQYMSVFEGTNCRKRRITTVNNNCSDEFMEESSKTPLFRACCRRFLAITASEHVYESQECKPKGETLYTSLKDNVLVNVQTIEQFSFCEGTYFIADEASRFVKTVQGIAINFWRYNNTAQKLFISRSFVFTNEQGFQDIKKQLENM